MAQRQMIPGHEKRTVYCAGGCRFPEDHPSTSPKDDPEWTASSDKGRARVSDSTIFTGGLRGREMMSKDMRTKIIKYLICPFISVKLVDSLQTLLIRRRRLVPTTRTITARLF